MAYVITAANHGLGQVPCNLNATLFGEFSSGDPTSETSQEFDFLVDAQAALVILENEGEWPDGRPEYAIEVTA